MNKESLVKLANYLLEGAQRAAFDMSYFHTPDGKDEYVTDCGTAGCAVGHGPYAGIPKHANEGWWDYSYRAFGVTEGRAWDWCFSGHWHHYDNTPRGAARRILCLVENGAPPAEWDHEAFVYGMIGQAQHSI